MNSFRPEVKVGFVVQVDVEQKCIFYMNDWLEAGGNILLTIQYTKTTD